MPGPLKQIAKNPRLVLLDDLLELLPEPHLGIDFPDPQLLLQMVKEVLDYRQLRAEGRQEQHLLHFELLFELFDFEAALQVYGVDYDVVFAVGVFLVDFVHKALHDCIEIRLFERAELGLRHEAAVPKDNKGGRYGFGASVGTPERQLLVLLAPALAAHAEDVHLEFAEKEETGAGTDEQLFVPSAEGLPHELALGLIALLPDPSGLLLYEACEFEEVVDDEARDETLGGSDFWEFVELVDHFALREVRVDVEQPFQRLHPQLRRLLLLVLGTPQLHLPREHVAVLRPLAV